MREPPVHSDSKQSRPIRQPQASPRTPPECPALIQRPFPPLTGCGLRPRRLPPLLQRSQSLVSRGLHSQQSAEPWPPEKFLSPAESAGPRSVLRVHRIL